MRLSGVIRLVICPLFAASAAGAQSPPSLDLRQALQIAESDNLELRAARQQRATALAGVRIARQLPNPTITVAASRDVPHESVLWEQPIELGGKRGKRIAVAEEERQATEIDIGILSRQVRRRTREAFYRVLVSRAQTAQSKSALDLASRLKQIVQQRFEAGDVAQLEVIQADVELARANADFEVTLQGQKSADALLAALLSRPLDESLSLQTRLEELPPAQTLAALNQVAQQSNADVRRTSQVLLVEQRRLALAKAQRIPNVSLQAGTDLNARPDFDVGGRGQLAFTLPLLYHGQGEVAQSSARLEFLRLSLASFENLAAAQVAGAYYDYLAKQRQAQQYERTIVPQTIRLEEMAEDSYRSGKSTLLILIDAQRRLNETRKTYLDSLFAVQSSFAALEEVVGTPLD